MKKRDRVTTTERGSITSFLRLFFFGFEEEFSVQAGSMECLGGEFGIADQKTMLSCSRR